MGINGNKTVSDTIVQLTRLSVWWSSLTQEQRMSVPQPMRGNIATVIKIAHEFTKFEGELPEGKE